MSATVGGVFPGDDEAGSCFQLAQPRLSLDASLPVDIRHTIVGCQRVAG